MVQKIWQWRTQTGVVLIVGLLVILIALVIAFSSSTFRPTVQVKVGQSGIYNTWLADTDATLYKGLSGVEQLSRDGGLLMDFKIPGYHGIVMRDMKVPLDIIWLDSQKKVVYLVKNASPELGDSRVFTPNDPARYVLELPAQSVKNSAIKVGDTAEFTLPVETP